MQVSLTISSKYQGINSHHLEEIVIIREGGGIVFVREGFIVKQTKNFETKNAEIICLKIVTGSDSSNYLSDAKDVFNLTNLVKKLTCFKSQDGTLIDLMLTNRPRSFLKSQNFEIGLNDCHKLIVSILRASFKKLPRKIITYRHLKHFNQDHFL